MGPGVVMSIFQLFKGRKTRGKGSPQKPPHHHDGRWSKVDKSWLTSGLSLAHANEVLHGATAEFYPDGQLFRLAYYCEGTLSEIHNQLELDRGIPCGRVTGHGVICTFTYGMEEVHLCLDGDAELTCEPAIWDDWVRKWIAHISAGGRVNIMPEVD